MDTIKINSKNVKMIAHRGLSGIERENTNPAFVAAGNRSYFGIETDVHVTSDGKFVIIHDETTDRVSEGRYKINVEKESYDKLKDVVLPDKDGNFVREDIKIPLLEEYIRICKKYEKVCVLEVKNLFSEEDIKRMIEEIRNTGYLENVIFISFVIENCIILRKYLKDNDIQWLLSNPVTRKEIDILKENNLNIDIYYKSLTKEAVDTLHENGIKVNCWTCDDKEIGESLAQMGVDFITTNILE